MLSAMVRGRVSSLGIGVKLYIIFGVLALFVATSSLISLQKFGIVERAVTYLVKDNITAVVESNEISTSFAQLNSALTNMLAAQKVAPLTAAYEKGLAIDEQVKKQAQQMTMPAQDKQKLVALLENVAEQLSAVHQYRKDILSLEKALNIRIAKMQAEHKALGAVILPLYDDAEFALMLELEDILGTYDLRAAQRFVEDKNGKMTRLLKIQSAADTVKGVYAATHMLSNAQLIIPFKERYVAAEAKAQEIIANFGGDLADVKQKTIQLFAHGKGKNNFFDQVSLLLQKKEELTKLVAIIEGDERQGAMILAETARKVKEGSEQEATGLMDELAASSTIVMVLFILFIVSVAGIIMLFVRPIIIGRLNVLSDRMHEVREGNLDCVIPVSGGDEITDMSKALERFREDAKRTKELEKQQAQAKIKAEEEKRDEMNRLADSFQQRVQSIIQSVASASAQLANTAQEMTSVITHSTETVQTASASAGETNSNVQSVASAVEEMSSSAKEISIQIRKANEQVSDSVQTVETADIHAKALAHATTRIKEVIQLISHIAGQINLLALNATIESARAGEAGRGFAVVANEVKHLASQTNESVSEIETVIREMNTAANDILSSLEDIKVSVDGISEASGSVAIAIEEQSATTNAIATNMSSAAGGATRISSNLEEIHQGVGMSQLSSQQVLGAAQELSSQAETLQKEVEGFVGDIRSA